ncbi:MAG: HAD family hydrolase [Eubacteriales bacterium]|nr:HAD family hydrolase [Eubacteriales bacterium]
MDSIIFDVDGTLWDSTEIVARAWTKALAEHTDYHMLITSARLHQLFGQLLPDIARQLFPEESQSRQLFLIDLCCQEEHRALLQECAPLYEDLEKMLKILHKQYPLYIVSNCQAGYIEVFLEATGFGRYFKGHLCPGDTGNAKAENIRQIIEENHLKAPVYVGDTAGDYKACQKAQIPFVFASYGFGQVEAPDYTIQRPMELVSLFSRC